MKKYMNLSVGTLALVILCLYLNTILDLRSGIVEAVVGFTTQSIVVSCALLILGVGGLVVGKAEKLWQNIVGLIVAVVHIAGFIYAGVTYADEVLAISTLASVPLFIFGLITIVNNIYNFIAYFVDKKTKKKVVKHEVKKPTQKVLGTPVSKEVHKEPSKDIVVPIPKKPATTKKKSDALKNPFANKGGKK